MRHEQILRAVSEPRRADLLFLTWVQERSAGDLHSAFSDVTFGAISQHLRVLKELGLVTCRRDGRHRYYRARKSALGPLRTWLERMWSQQLDKLALLAAFEAAADTNDKEDST
jgi:DNA-binding transcriptional ArsR family regulator